MGREGWGGELTHIAVPANALAHIKAGLHLGGGGGREGILPPWKLCAPLGDFNPSKLNTAHYTHAPHTPKTSSDVLLPPLRDFTK